MVEKYDSLSKQNNYSTEEQVIGTWIDGKPIYRNYVLKDATVTDGSTPTVASWNIDKVVRVYGSAVFPGNLILPYSYMDSTGSCFTGVFKSNNTCMYVHAKSDGSPTTFTHTTIVVEYTKTTD